MASNAECSALCKKRTLLVAPAEEAVLPPGFGIVAAQLRFVPQQQHQEEEGREDHKDEADGDPHGKHQRPVPAMEALGVYAADSVLPAQCLKNPKYHWARA